MPPTILFEDDTILVIDKPSGIVVHPFDFSTETTLLDFLHTHAPGVFSIHNPITLQDGRTINLGGIVHKLDRDTSGVLVVAKTQEAFETLREQFRNHTTKKTYLALVDGIVETDTLTIDAPLGRNKKDYKQVAYPANPRGELRDAVTHIEVLVRNSDTTHQTTLVRLSPVTGRTHQLRAHMAYIGHPIVGDVAYGSTTECERIMLHAESLTIFHKDEEKTFTSTAPNAFTGESASHKVPFF
jgi:23S rRNA pseudouridine1911/1915/1917 synthase